MKVLKTSISPGTAIIPDIHQCNGMLRQTIELCKEVGVKSFIFLGDILDRGPDPVGTVETLLEIKDISTFLVGNHDFKITRFREGRSVTLTEEQARNVETFKEKNIYEAYCNLFYQEYVALLDEDQKVMLSHAPGGRPARFMEKYNRHELGKNDYSRLLYGITRGDTKDGVPVRMPITDSPSDNLEGWLYFFGHTHANRLHVEPSPNMFSLDFLAGQPGGRLATWVVEDTVKNGKLLVVNEDLSFAWNPEADMMPYEPSSH